MRRISKWIAMFLIAVFFPACGGDIDPSKSRGGGKQEGISISGAWALYPLALKWVEEYRKVDPGVTIDVQAGGAGKGMTDVLTGMVDIGMVSRDIHPVETERGAFPLAVAKDAVLPTLSAKNPYWQEIRARGLTREEFINLWIRGKDMRWEGLLGRTGISPVRIYTRSDACGAAETWSAFLGGRQEDLGGIGVYGDPGLAEAVRRDPLGIGYNNVNFAFDSKTLRPVEGLGILPIDLDGDGRIGEREAVYETRDDIVKAIAEGVYPSPPARELYFVTKGRPDVSAVNRFLKWVLTEGQAYVLDAGYIPLSADRLAEALGRIESSGEGR